MSHTSANGRTAVRILHESVRVTVPDWVVDVESFRRWADAEDFPDHVRVGYLKGEVWVDMSKEQLFTHSRVKMRITSTLDRLVEQGNLGFVFADGVLLSNEEAVLSGNPDAVFVSTASVQCKRVQLVEGVEEGYVELEGSPDMVLEVVSSSSVQKDTVELRQGYWDAGVSEYWLVDARKEPLSFEILRRTSRGYIASRKKGGWVKSAVFGKSFRLTQTTGPLGHPSFTLEVR